LVLTLVDPVLSTFLAGTAALVALYPLSRWPRYAEQPEGITDRPAMRDQAVGGTDDAPAPMGLVMSFLPYIVLTVITVAVLVIAPLNTALRALSVGLPFPTVSTGYGIVREATEPYSAFSPLTHPGTFLLITSFLTWIVYGSRGYYGAWVAQSRDETQPDRSILGGLFADAVPASVPVIAFLAMSQLMDHSGQTEVLALGIAEVAPAYVFAFMANGIGALGAFMTSSSTSSNVLFSDLQQTVAHLKGLPDTTIIAAQSAGGAIGNAIAPANVVLGASTAGISGQEGEILRKTLPWTIAAVLLTGAATLLLL
jgi:lactate permease